MKIARPKGARLSAEQSARSLKDAQTYLQACWPGVSQPHPRMLADREENAADTRALSAALRKVAVPLRELRHFAQQSQALKAIDKSRANPRSWFLKSIAHRKIDVRDLMALPSSLRQAIGGLTKAVEIVGQLERDLAPFVGRYAERERRALYAEELLSWTAQHRLPCAPLHAVLWEIANGTVDPCGDLASGDFGRRTRKWSKAYAVARDRGASKKVVRRFPKAQEQANDRWLAWFKSLPVSVQAGKIPPDVHLEMLLRARKAAIAKTPGYENLSELAGMSPAQLRQAVSESWEGWRLSAEHEIHEIVLAQARGLMATLETIPTSFSELSAKGT